MAYVSLISGIECLGGYHYKNRLFDFDDVPKFNNLKSILDKLNVLGGTDLVEQLKNALIQNEHFLIRKFCLLIADFLPDDFWTTSDDRYEIPPLASPDSKQALAKSLKAVYNVRSAYVHAGTPFPAHIEFGLGERMPATAAMAALEISISGTNKGIPPFVWFERVAHFVIREYLQRFFAPEIVKVHQENAKEKAGIHSAIRNLPRNVRESLRKLVFWTRRFLGMLVIIAPNKEWADEEASVIALREADLIDTTDPTIAGTSWIKNRELGEAVGEFFFGTTANPFRGNEILLPKGWEEIFQETDRV
jgi:hypothetical protein